MPTATVEGLEGVVGLTPQNPSLQNFQPYLIVKLKFFAKTSFQRESKVSLKWLKSSTHTCLKASKRSQLQYAQNPF